MYDTIIIPLGKHQRQWFKIQYRMQPPCAWMKASTFVLYLQLVIACTALVAVAIPDVSFVHEVQLPVHGSLACQRHASSDSNRVHDWPWKKIHGFTLKVGGHCPSTMRPGVVIHRYKLVGVWRNRELQLVARYLWCSDHQLGFLV